MTLQLVPFLTYATSLRLLFVQLGFDHNGGMAGIFLNLVPGYFPVHSVQVVQIPGVG